MTPDHVIIAVDGGNSKTDIAVLGDDGCVLATARGPGSSPHHLGLDGALAVVESLIDAAWAQAGLGPRDGHEAAVGAIFMAGADLQEEERVLTDAIRARRWAARVHVANDVFAVLWAGTGSGMGVAVTVGAGINCAGRAPGGRRAWFPALGAITGDWGGGPDIGMAALGAAVRAEDGRGPATALAARVAGYFGLSSALDVAIAIHQGRLDPGRLIELPSLVVELAEAGDGEAMAILNRQADEVIALATSAIHQIGVTSAAVDVVLGGSILTGSGEMVLSRIRRGVQHVAPEARVSLCPTRPVVGAALAGLQMMGGDDTARDRVREALGRDGASLLRP